MNKVLFILLLVLFVPNVFAGTIEQAGFAVTPQTKTHSDVTGIETDTVVWTPESGRKIILMGIAYWSDTLGNFFVESDSTKVIPTCGISTASGVTVIDGGYPIWRGEVDATLTYTVAVDCDHSILMWGYEE